ncbi:DUF4367 domain-containing protein [Heliobacillus mobilis]|uniref:DUF4367 domain-containing protein n=1 Tax=Heliobacterium mobile TaxID=28064 RepID=A0A6I3SMA6_HELMO|nr:DUF4367 domain-containing protein [Heliobacterium mobile]MTV49752.1 DUF4367 domain-containing protein [Heliobacterium mobile]
MNKWSEPFLDQRIEEAVREMVENSPTPDLEASWSKFEQKLQERPVPTKPSVKGPAKHWQWAVAAAAALLIGSSLAVGLPGRHGDEQKVASLSSNVVAGSATTAKTEAAKSTPEPSGDASGILSSVNQSNQSPVEAFPLTTQPAPEAEKSPASPTDTSKATVSIAENKTSLPPKAEEPPSASAIQKDVPLLASASADKPAVNEESSLRMGIMAMAEQPQAKRALKQAKTISLELEYIPAGYQLVASSESEKTTENTKELRYKGTGSTYFRLSATADPSVESQSTITRENRSVEKMTIQGCPGELVFGKDGVVLIDWVRDGVYYRLEGNLPKDEAEKVAQHIK